jgi:DUF4097 and DUF4098 domain-containing protein YvlB
MESRNRNAWIIAAVALVIACCCILALVVAAAAGLFVSAPLRLGGVPGFQSEQIEQVFEVGTTPVLTVDNVAGSVTVRAGEGRTIQVVATKRAPLGGDLARIDVTMTQQDNGLVIQTRTPSTLSNVSVDLEITAPADTRLDLHTGAGSVDVSGLQSKVQADTGAGSVRIADVTGEIELHSGAGSLEARGVSGPIRLDTGAGSIQYEGTPQGDCRFESGAGSIALTLPADLNMAVDLETGMGTVGLGFAVDGQVSRQKVKGTIGSGDQGSIYAHTGTGSVDLIKR